MNHSPSLRKAYPRIPAREQGVVLFFALIALVALALAAVALIRSVDTSTIISGNLSFRQSATNAGDSGVDAAMNWMTDIQNNNSAINVLTDAAHPFNVTDLATNPGYYSNVDDAAVDLFDPITWDPDEDNSALAGTDPTTGNTVRYVIQRMCRNAGQVPSVDHCLFSAAVQDSNGQSIPLPQEVCTGSGCPVAGQAPQFRITVRSEGPRFSVSYIQAFVY